MFSTGYNPPLVVLSVAVAILASYTALDLAGRIRGAAPRRRGVWTGAAAVAMGGGIWSMHFIGMLAVRMSSPATYEIGRTALSLAIAIGVTGAAFAWVGRPGAGLKDIAVSGPLMGLGIAAMHYTGMSAMTISGDMVYSLPVVALSVGIAMTAATAALWLAFREHDVWQRLGAAFVMGVAVAGMHYTGMAAATFTASDAGSPAAHAAALAPSQLDLALVIAGATFAVLFIALITSSVEQQRVQRDLRSSEARFRAAILAVSGVLWTNDAKGRMVGEQPGWAAITGQSFAEYQGFGWADAVHPDDAQPTIDAWNETVAGKRMFVFEHRVRLHDGGWGRFAIRAVPILNSAGEIREWVGVHTDITAQRKAESDLRESNEEIQRFAYIVSHDLRSPLVNVMGFASELAALQGDIRAALDGHPRQAEIDGDLGEALAFIKASVQRMERMIAAILKLSRDGRRSFQPEPINLTALVRIIVDAQHHQIEAAGASVTIAADLPAIVADRLALEQIFGNLVDNAVKYLDPARPGRIEVTAVPAGGGFLCVEVKDNGRGIAARDHQRVFELFRRAGAQDRPGEGIGLAHVRSLVRVFGGTIAVESEPDVGSTFRVTLPCGVDGWAGAEATAAAAERRRSSGVAAVPPRDYSSPVGH